MADSTMPLAGGSFQFTQFVKFETSAVGSQPPQPGQGGSSLTVSSLFNVQGASNSLNIGSLLSVQTPSSSLTVGSLLNVQGTGQSSSFTSASFLSVQTPTSSLNIGSLLSVQNTPSALNITNVLGVQGAVASGQGIVTFGLVQATSLSYAKPILGPGASDPVVFGGKNAKGKSLGASSDLVGSKPAADPRGKLVQAPQSDKLSKGSLDSLVDSGKPADQPTFRTHDDKHFG